MTYTRESLQSPCARPSSVYTQWHPTSSRAPAASFGSTQRPTSTSSALNDGVVAPATTESTITPHYSKSNCSDLEFAMGEETELVVPDDFLPVPGQQSNSPIMVNHSSDKLSDADKSSRK